MPPVEVSFSRIQAYQRCPWMYHLVYNLGWRSGPNSAMAMGQSLHRTLAAYHDPSNAEKTLERLFSLFDESWVNEGFQNTQETLDAYDQGRKILETYFQTDATDTAEVVSVEKEYTWALDGNVQFRWTLDRLDRLRDGGYEIVEYKSNAHHWSAARRDNDLQMTLYLFGMKKALGTDAIKLKYHFLSTNERVSTRRTEEQLRSAEEMLKSTADKIRLGVFEPNAEYCGKCEFANRCSKFRKPEGDNQTK